METDRVPITVEKEEVAKNTESEGWPQSGMEGVARNMEREGVVGNMDWDGRELIYRGKSNEKHEKGRGVLKPGEGRVGEKW